MVGIMSMLAGMVMAEEVFSLTPLKAAAAELKEEMPAAPADGILDKANVFTPAQRKVLAAELEAFRKKEQFRIYIVAYTFVYGEDSNQRAQRLGQLWLAKEPGIVIVFDKGGKGDSPVIGMAWQQDEEILLPNTLMLGILKKAKAAADKEPVREPIKGLTAAVHAFISDFDQVRVIIDAKRSEARARQVKIVLCVLGAMFVSLMLLALVNKHQRNRERKKEEFYLFPEVEMTPRYGAPYGGGVVVQMHYGPPAERTPSQTSPS